MPTVESLSRQGRVVVSCGIQHHLDDALDLFVRMTKTTDVHAEATTDRRPDLLRIESFPLDIAGFLHVLGERFEKFIEDLSDSKFVALDTAIRHVLAADCLEGHSYITMSGSAISR